MAQGSQRLLPPDEAQALDAPSRASLADGGRPGVTKSVTQRHESHMHQGPGLDRPLERQACGEQLVVGMGRDDQQPIVPAKGELATGAHHGRASPLFASSAGVSSPAQRASASTSAAAAALRIRSISARPMPASSYPSIKITSTSGRSISRRPWYSLRAASSGADLDPRGKRPENPWGSVAIVSSERRKAARP